MRKTCKKCKSFSKHDYDNRGDCNNSKIFGYRSSDDDGIEEEGYESETSIGPEFGCIHWEEKE